MIDALTSPTLKHLREHWWNDEFTEFLAETLRPRPGNRILDVGCGEGLAELSIGGLHLSQMSLTGVDLVPSKLGMARQAMAAHNQRASFAAGDARRLPFVDRVFDAVVSVAVLQHIHDVAAAVAEISRVVRKGGRVVAVEPDNAARYFFSSAPSGQRAFLAARRLFASIEEARGSELNGTVGPKLPALFDATRLEPIAVRLFPVSRAELGAPADALWTGRRDAIERLLDGVADPRVRACGGDCLAALGAYQAEAAAAGAGFVEIQNTMLFATVAERRA